MTVWLLGTNAIFTLVTAGSAALLRRVEALATGALSASSVVAHELFLGAYRSRKVAFNLETLRLLFADVGILDLDREDARAAGEIRAELARQGRPIGPYDVLIADQAKARGLTLLANDTVEFTRAVGLRVEDWTAG